MSILGTTIANMDCFYIVDRQEWFKVIDDGCLCEVAKARAAQDDNFDEEDRE